MKNSLDLFSKTEYVSTNMILIIGGIAVVGAWMVLVASGAYLYTLIAYLKGRKKY